MPRKTTKKPEIQPTITEVRVLLANNGWVLMPGVESSRMCMPEMWIANTPQEIGAIMAKHGVKPKYPARKR